MTIKQLEFDIETKKIFPSNVHGVPNYAYRAPLFCAPEEYFVRLHSLTKTIRDSDGVSLECFREEEGLKFGLEMRQTGDKMENSKGEFVDIGIGVYATKSLQKGTELPVWGSIGLKSEFSESQLNMCDRKVGVEFARISNSASDYIMLIHRGCICGYINDYSAPYDIRQQNCVLRIKSPHFDHNRAEYYVCVEITKNIEAHEQLLFNYGKRYWEWENNNNNMELVRRVRRKTH